MKSRQWRAPERGQDMPAAALYERNNLAVSGSTGGGRPAEPTATKSGAARGSC
ncbi:hypothetical protein [Streptomyces sp. NPDC059209]|uniref:hypothetical protein n=1 Tax=Streptomyces sp. NPDC059209 TaxID=3346769 RepID=UPI0036C16953